jgi:hypothetical protein
LLSALVTLLLFVLHQYLDDLATAYPRGWYLVAMSLMGVYFLLSLNVAPYLGLIARGQIEAMIAWTSMGAVFGFAALFPLIAVLGLEGAALSRLFYAVTCLGLFVPFVGKSK